VHRRGGNNLSGAPMWFKSEFCYPSIVQSTLMQSSLAGHPHLKLLENTLHRSIGHGTVLNHCVSEMERILRTTHAIS
jgi:hypothetical protein